MLKFGHRNGCHINNIIELIQTENCIMHIPRHIQSFLSKICIPKAIVRQDSAKNSKFYRKFCSDSLQCTFLLLNESERNCHCSDFV